MHDSSNWKRHVTAFVAAGTMALGSMTIATVAFDASTVSAQPRGRGRVQVGVQVGGDEVRGRGRDRGRRVVTIAPPAVQVEVQGRAPSPRHVWTAGYWGWNGSRYVWTRGRWQRPARAGVVWQAPQWTQQNGEWVFVEGAWVQAGASAQIPGPVVVQQQPPQPQVYVQPQQQVYVQPQPQVYVQQQPGTTTVMVNPRANTVIQQAPVEEYADVNGPAARVSVGMVGRPTSLDRGDAAGYWIWYTPDGVWHLRTTTAGRERRFQGRIVGEGGATAQVVSTTRTELGDRVVQRPRAVHFDFRTQGGIDGVDFRVANNACVRFRLRLDGEQDVKRIFLGAQASTAPSDHFIVCPR